MLGILYVKDITGLLAMSKRYFTSTCHYWRCEGKLLIQPLLPQSVRKPPFQYGPPANQLKSC